MLAVPRPEVRIGALVAILREDLVARDRDVVEEETALGGILRLVAGLDRDRLDVDRRTLLHPDSDAYLVALRRQLEIVRDEHVIVAVVAVELAQPLQVGRERRRLERGRRLPELPDLVPTPRLRHHRFTQHRRADGRVAVEGQRRDPPLACRVERFQLDGVRAARKD